MRKIGLLVGLAVAGCGGDTTQVVGECAVSDLGDCVEISCPTSGPVQVCDGADGEQGEPGAIPNVYVFDLGTIESAANALSCDFGSPSVSIPEGGSVVAHLRVEQEVDINSGYSVGIQARLAGDSGTGTALYTAQAFPNRIGTSDYVASSVPLDSGAYEFGVCAQIQCNYPDLPECLPLTLTDMQLIILEVAP